MRQGQAWRRASEWCFTAAVLWFVLAVALLVTGGAAGPLAVVVCGFLIGVGSAARVLGRVDSR